MTARPLGLPVVLALMAVAGGCRHDAGEATIGLALQPGDRNILAAKVAEAALARTAQRGDPIIRVQRDTIVVGDNLDAELQRARSLLASPNLVGVVGHSSSRGSIAAAPFYDSAGVPMLTAVATSRILRRAGPYTFQLPATDVLQGRFIGRFLKEALAARHVAVFYQNDEYGIGLRDGIATELRMQGITLDAARPFVGSSQLEVMVDAIYARARPDVVVVAGQTIPTARIASAAVTRNPDVSIVAGDAAVWTTVLRQVLPAVQHRLFVTSLWTYVPGDSAQDEFVERFRELAHRDPEPFDALTYDAVMVMGTGVRTVGVSRKRLAEWLDALQNDPSRLRLLTGVFSPTSLTQTSMRITQWKNAQPTPIWP